MGGICGLFNPGLSPVAEADLAALTSVLETRGPDASGRWGQDFVGLGHTMLATTQLDDLSVGGERLLLAVSGSSPRLD